MKAPVVIAAVLAAFLLGALATLWLGKPPANQPAATPQTPAAELVRSLLGENLADRTFPFPTVAEACSGKKVLPLTDAPPHQRALAAIEQAMVDTLREMNAPDSPVRKSRRINEASRFFEDALLARLAATPGFSCGIPPTRAGSQQRSGYPDLRLVEQASGSVF